MLAVGTIATAAAHRQAISALQYTTPDQWEELELPTVVNISFVSPHTKRVAPPKTRSHANNDDERPKPGSKQAHIQSSPNLQTSQSDNPATSSAIKIKLKLNLSGPEPGSDHKSETRKESANHGAKLRPKTPVQPIDQEEIAASTTTDPKPLSQARPPSSTVSAQQQQQRHHESLTPIRRKPEHTTDGGGRGGGDTTESARGRTLRQNPTPSRKRRYSEHQHEHENEPSSSQKSPRGPSQSGQKTRGGRGRGRPRGRPRGSGRGRGQERERE